VSPKLRRKTWQEVKKSGSQELQETSGLSQRYIIIMKVKRGKIMMKYQINMQKAIVGFMHDYKASV